MTSVAWSIEELVSYSSKVFTYTKKALQNSERRHPFVRSSEDANGKSASEPLIILAIFLLSSLTRY